MTSRSDICRGVGRAGVSALDPRHQRKESTVAGLTLLHPRVENLPAGTVARQAEGPLAVGQPHDSRADLRPVGGVAPAPRVGAGARRRDRDAAGREPHLLSLQLLERPLQPAVVDRRVHRFRRPDVQPLGTPALYSRNTASTISFCLLTSSAAVVAQRLGPRRPAGAACPRPASYARRRSLPPLCSWVTPPSRPRRASGRPHFVPGEVPSAQTGLSASRWR